MKSLSQNNRKNNKPWHAAGSTSSKPQRLRLCQNVFCHLLTSLAPTPNLALLAKEADLGCPGTGFSPGWPQTHGGLLMSCLLSAFIIFMSHLVLISDNSVNLNSSFTLLSAYRSERRRWLCFPVASDLGAWAALSLCLPLLVQE